MLRLTLKNLRANRVRFAMTTFAVVLAVSFVVSSFVLTDGLRSTFGDPQLTARLTRAVAGARAVIYGGQPRAGGAARRFFREAAFFEPTPFVKRVVFIATPHRGAPMADNLVGGIGNWIGHRRQV